MYWAHLSGSTGKPLSDSSRRTVPSSRFLEVEVVTLAGVVEDTERRVEEERGRIEAEYREVLKSSLKFEKDPEPLAREEPPEERPYCRARSAYRIARKRTGNATSRF
jgi:hypothetical protein